MKNSKMTAVVLVVLAIVVFSACKKDETKTKTEYLTAKSWKISGATVNGADFFGIMDPCEKDDVDKYSSGGSLSRNHGSLKCDSTEASVVTGSWAFINNEAGLRVIADGDTIEGTIATLDATTLKVNVSDGGLNAVFIYTAQ